MNKGFVLVATGHPCYGTWALNLCISIRASDPTAKITLLCDAKGNGHISTFYYLFDQVIEIPKEMLISNGMESFIRAKVCLYDLSPYDKTIFIDSDVIGFPQKKVTDLFNECEAVEFTIGNRGKVNPEQESKYAWASAKSIMDAYNYDGDIYNLSSEFIYFKKGSIAKMIFDEAKEAFDNTEIEYRRFAGGIPDELAFQIAMIKTGSVPHKENFLPFYWEAHEKKQLALHELYQTPFFGYSMGGNAAQQIPLENYNNLAKYYQRQFGLKHPFLMRDKREILPNRTQI